MIYSTLIQLLLSLCLGVSPSAQAAPALSMVGKQCDVYDDDQHIPHVRVKAADPQAELTGIACLGYIHGRDRSWQMDYFRKTVRGQKAEYFGKNAIQSDFFMHLLGLQEKGNELFAQLAPAEQDFFRAYATGINVGMKEALAKGVYEFEKLGYRPGPWIPEDTLGLMMLQSFDQTRRSFQIQLDQLGWQNEFGEGANALFNTKGLPWDTSVLKPGEYPEAPPAASYTAKSVSPKSSVLTPEVRAELRKVLGSLALFPEDLEKEGGNGQGSNNWVLGPKLSESGHAWLANDPHLTLGYPPFWELVHVTAGKIDAIGATFPGVPLIVSGSNRTLSWGLTNAFLPAARLSLVPAADLENHAGQRGGSVKTRPWIWFKFGFLKLPFFFKTYLKTPTGLPVLPLPSTPVGKAFVLRWTGFDLRPSDIAGMTEIMKATTVAEADRAFAHEGVPSWNFVFADIYGGIGYRAVGRIPRFEREPSFGVPSESLRAVEDSAAFQNPLNSDEMPHVLNPKRGFIVSANNKQWPADSLWSAGRAHAQGFRAFRIEELLQKKARHDLASQQKVQCDVQAVDARFLLPDMLKLLIATSAGTSKLADAGDAVRALRQWDFEAGPDCRACGVFRRWMDHIFELQKFNATSFYRKLKGEEDALNAGAAATGPKAGAAVIGKIVSEAFFLALDDLGYFGQHQLPKWSDIHLNFFTHISEDPRFDVKPIRTPGDENSVNPGTASWMGSGKYFKHDKGASQRLLVEMSNPPQVYSVLSGSNQDLAARDLSDPHSEWQRWLHCEQQRRAFPLDWNQISFRVKNLE
jgi:penicillin amidase